MVWDGGAAQMHVRGGVVGGRVWCQCEWRGLVVCVGRWGLRCAGWGGV